MKLSLEYIILGLAVLFVVTLLYGTWRRQEQFTTIQGNYPPWSVIQQQVRAIFDKYYDYDLSAFASIEETDIFPAVKERVEKLPMIYGLLVSNFKPNSEMNEVKAFFPKGFVVDVVNSPITTYIGVGEAARKWVASLIKAYNPKKPTTAIDNLIQLHYATELSSVSFKNEVIIEFIGEAMKRVKPKPKTS